MVAAPLPDVAFIVVVVVVVVFYAATALVLYSLPSAPSAVVEGRQLLATDMLRIGIRELSFSCLSSPPPCTPDVRGFLVSHSFLR